MKKIINMLNVEPTKGQTNNEPSMTVPDQSMSLRELLTRYARGLPLEGAKTPIWEGEEGFDKDPETLDLAEREDLAEKAREELKNIEEKIKNSKKKKTDKEYTDYKEVKDEKPE
jgi:hypothetical protein